MQRFVIEAQALGRLNHPNVVTLHDFGHTDAGEPFLVMEYLEGQCLADLRGVHLSMQDVVGIAKPIVTALTYAHHQGVVHRDLKPENVFLVDTFSGERLVKVLDFGLAKLIGEMPTDITQSGEVMGTTAYMSPEQLRAQRELGPSTDLYAVGVMLFEMAERRLPFMGASPFEIGMAHLLEPVPPMRRPELPPDFEELVRRLLAKEPAGRPPTAVALYEALDGIRFATDDTTLRLVVSEPVDTLDGEPPDFSTHRNAPPSFDQPDPEATIPTTPSRQRRVTAGVLVIGVGLLIGMGAVIAANPGSSPDSEPPEPATTIPADTVAPEATATIAAAPDAGSAGIEPDLPAEDDAPAPEVAKPAVEPRDKKPDRRIEQTPPEKKAARPDRQPARKDPTTQSANDLVPKF